jgi:imidazolonepropionase-like amidohydrolase
MTLLRLGALALGATLGFSLYAQDGLIAIRGARVFDGTGSPARAATVLIRGSRIEAVGAGVAVPQGARIIEGAGQTLLPGLIDLHTHISASAAMGVPVADTGKVFKAYLARGVTSIVDMSSYGEMFGPLRELMANGTLPGPHIVFASRMSTPGGHGAEIGFGETVTTEVASAPAVHLAMQRILSYKPDAIKAFTDGWRYGSIPNLSSMNFETVAAIVADAHAAHIKVLSHTVTLAGAKIAARAGVDVIDHGIGDLPADDELIQLLKTHGTHYGFTLAVYQPKNIGDPPPSLSGLLEPAILKALSARRQPPVPSEAPGDRNARFAVFEANAAALHKAGIPIGDGTDAGMTQTFHGWATLREIELLANDCGFTPTEALSAATKVSAEALGVDRDRGTIAPGKLADLVLVEGNPDQDIKAIENTRLVVFDGKILDPKALEAAIHSSEMTAMPSHKLGPLVDDLERTDNRTSLDTLRIETLDSGADHSRVIIARVIREGNNHALLANAHFGPAEHPFVRLEVPVTRGAVELGDVSSFRGISFDARGENQYRLLLKTYGVRNSDWYGSDFSSSGAWKTVRIPFSEFKRREQSPAWQCKDLRSLVFEMLGPADSVSSLELDNIAFY